MNESNPFRAFLNERLLCYRNSPLIDEIVAEHERLVNEATEAKRAE